jgi:antagonist of KipI
MIEILQPGVLTTLQDGGRFGHLARGINPGGAMDSFAMGAANAVIGNGENEAVLEMHFPAAAIRFREPAIIAIGGAQFSAGLFAAQHDGVPMDLFRPYVAAAGSTIVFRGRVIGSRVYLAVRGGLDVPAWLGSRSTNMLARAGGFQGRALRRQDVIPLRESAVSSGNSRRMPWRVVPSLLERVYTRELVRVIPGPEWNWLTDAGRDAFLKSQFSITTGSDRTGYRLEGRPLEKENHDELLSSGVAFGTVQLLPSGQLIVLMADHPVTGGYPRIANVITADLPFLAQQGAPDQVRFSLVSQGDAELSYRSIQGEMETLRTASQRRLDQWLHGTSI